MVKHWLFKCLMIEGLKIRNGKLTSRCPGWTKECSEDSKMENMRYFLLKMNKSLNK